MKSLTAMMSSRGSHFSWGCQGLGLPFLPQPLLTDCSGQAPRFRPAQPFTQHLSCCGRGWGSSRGTAPRPLGTAIHCWGCLQPYRPLSGLRDGVLHPCAGLLRSCLCFTSVHRMGQVIHTGPSQKEWEPWEKPSALPLSLLQAAPASPGSQRLAAFWVRDRSLHFKVLHVFLTLWLKLKSIVSKGTASRSKAHCHQRGCACSPASSPLLAVRLVLALARALLMCQFH